MLNKQSDSINEKNKLISSYCPLFYKNVRNKEYSDSGDESFFISMVNRVNFCYPGHAYVVVQFTHLTFLHAVP